MANEITIPILPCRSIADMLTFYTALGFEITYQQARPNTYACVKRGDINLHFFVLKELDPAQSYSTCLISVLDADELYKAFSVRLCHHYGKLPVVGIPRLTPLRNKAGSTRGFNVIDPGGNWIRINQRVETEGANDEPDISTASLTRLMRAIRAADLLAESKGDAAAAATMLDTALAYDESNTSLTRIQALVLRASLALTMNDEPLTRSLLAEVQQTPLSDHDRAALTEEFQRAVDLEQMLTEA